MKGRFMYLTKYFMLFLVLSFFACGTKPEKSLQKSEEKLAPQLEVLRPYLGKTWKGFFANSTPEKPMYDIATWERALNGHAVRTLHSVNDGEYGGESIIFWDSNKQSLVYFYFTTASFYTTGTMTFEDGKVISHEYVTGNQNGITEVKSIAEVLSDGKLQNNSQYFQNGQWVDGHEITYAEAPTAKVIFK
jgi:hypothetical protein